MRVLRWAAVAVLLAALGLAGVVAAREPSLDRDWDEDVAVLAGVGITDDGRVALRDVRDWAYTEDEVVAKDYFDATYDPADIADVWLYEQQLDDAGLIAHTFVVFEFPDSYGRGRWLGMSVETRRESDEEYSIIGGMLRAFEVTHIWATEEDLVTRRVRYLDYPLTRYRLRIPEGVAPRIFTQLARETAALATTPRWYNTATNNCTSSLIRYVNESEPGAIPRHPSWVLTGTVDDYLEELGFLDGGSAVAITKEYLAREPLR
ncbi:MAG TPA: DUF4105 domain-containing protein [Longimicrobiales bacterium]|nr:DUF4105 domain-containing protein [Longimicrobiales bacterium]